MRSCSDVHNYLLERGVAHEIVQLPALSSTARRAAALLGVPPREVVKSLLFEHRTAVRSSVSCPATRASIMRGSAPSSAAAAPCRSRRPRSCRSPAIGPGALPPCGLAAELPVVADPGVFELPVVYCGGGTTTTMLKIRSADLRAALGARVAAIAV